ncbi:uncharacterized protein LOC128198988 isoform X2 [Bicyclus anynana]|uniref:Uncharacterized protein LOC128198988 isoform X2 n=1 Tax=Bicyclus anynana TaxID=110368 RepID=A0ABM3LVM8_BICAN|nr:uncharacterized protein LOC128198988 isoform X2 [Bicyclus anynana]
MGIIGSREKQVSSATSNSSLTNLRYIISPDKSKWKMFRKKEIKAYPVQLKPMKGCPCGNDGICKQKITPKGVTIHYPQKKKKFGNMQINKPNIFTAKCEKGYSETPRPKTNVKLIKQKKSTFWKV